MTQQGERSDYCTECGTAPCSHTHAGQPPYDVRVAVTVALAVGLVLGIIVGLLLSGIVL